MEPCTISRIYEKQECRINAQGGIEIKDESSCSYVTCTVQDTCSDFDNKNAINKATSHANIIAKKQTKHTNKILGSTKDC